LDGNTATNAFCKIRLRPIASRSETPDARSVAHNPTLTEIFIAPQQAVIDCFISCNLSYKSDARLYEPPTEPAFQAAKKA
jgi:hypothetical protein